MKPINESTIPWTEQRSPKGHFQIFRKHLSETHGAPRDAGVAGGGHPFDMELSKLPPGAVNFPFHSHSAQWEAFIIVSGSGILRLGEDLIDVKGGDSFVCPPGTPHQLKSTGPKDLIYYVIADNPPSDLIHYPDSNKWLMKPQKKCFTITDAEYFAPDE
jgi:uncharacterized cupin superfamily protein